MATILMSAAFWTGVGGVLITLTGCWLKWRVFVRKADADRIDSLFRRLDEVEEKLDREREHTAEVMTQLVSCTGDLGRVKAERDFWKALVEEDSTSKE